MAVASVGLYASLHLAADRQPCQHPTTLFFTGRMPFLPPKQQRQSTEQQQQQQQQPFNGLFSRTTWVSRYQKGKTNLDFTEARDSEWQWNLLVHMQVCISIQTDNHTSTPLLSFLQAGCPSCRLTNSVKALNNNNNNNNDRLTAFDPGQPG